MIALKDVAEQHGLTRRQMRSLFEAIEPAMAGQVERGERNAILLPDEVLPLIEKALQLHSDGLSWSAVADKLPPVAGQEGPEEATADHEGTAPDANAELAETLIAIHHKLNELEAKVNRALQLPALRPWYRRWFGWLFRLR